MYARFFVGAALVAALSGCPGSLSGTVGGNSLNVADSVFYPLLVNGSTNSIIAVLVDKGGVCTSLKANRTPKSAKFMMFQIFSLDSSGNVLAPATGEYTVVRDTPSKAGNWAYAAFHATDATCTDSLSADARTGKSGLITVTSLNAATNGSASGTFDITFGASDRVTGSFNSAYCSVPEFSSASSCE